LAYCRPLLHIPHLHIQDSCLYTFHPIVVPNSFMMIFFYSSVLSDLCQLVGQSIIIGQNGSSFSISAEVFSRKEAEACRDAVAANGNSFIGSQMCVSAIFNQV